MKIGVTQLRPVKGDIQANIPKHGKLINLAALHAADAIFFPELSLTGYEPTLAKELASGVDDSRFEGFQELSDTRNITIGVGMPTKTGSGILISMIIFQPDCPRRSYSKQYLHPDEFPYFVNGQQPLFLNVHNSTIAPAICYELSVPAHADFASKNGAEFYVASVAKTLSGAGKALETLSGIAKNYSMITLMSNCVGICDGVECGGKTSIWNNQGVLAGQLDDACEGVLIMDTVTQELIEERLE